MAHPALKFKFTAVALGACLLLAFGLRLYQLDSHSLWYDELLELDIARRDVTAINAGLTRHAAMPLDYWLLHGWILLGRQDTWVRLPALFFGVLSVPLVYALARRMVNRRVGVLAAALLALSFFSVRYSREVRPYSMLLFFSLLAYLGLWQVCRSHRARDGLLLVAGLAGAALTHYFALFLLPPMALFVFVTWAWHPRRKLIWRPAAMFGLALLTVLLVFTLSGRFWKLYSVGQRFVKEAGQPTLYTLPAGVKPNGGSGPPLTTDFLIEKILMPLSTVEPVTLLLANLLLLAGLLWLLRRQARHSAALTLLAGWLLLPIVLIYLFLLHRGTFFASRYILFVLPPYLILTACGIDAATEWLAGALGRMTQNPQTGGLWAGLSLALLAPLLLAQGLMLHTYAAADSREDWRAVAQLLRDNATPGDFIVAVNAAETLDWYLPDAQTSVGRFSQNRVFWQAVQSHPRRWIVLSSYSGRTDQPLQRWLAAHGAVKIPIDRRVTLFFHAEGQSPAQMLADISKFKLPPKPLLLTSLADQLAAQRQPIAASALYRQVAGLIRHLPPATSLSARVNALR